MIANHPLGLPGGKNAKRAQFGDDGRGRGIGAVPHHLRGLSDRQTVEMIFSRVERKPLLARRLDHQDRLTRHRSDHPVDVREPAPRFNG
jgi:hypothetical protein